MALCRTLALVALCAGALVTAAPAGAAPRVLTVDGSSIGGRCSDARPAPKVSMRRPLCTIERALELAGGDGGTIAVRRGTYRYLDVRGFRPRTPLVIRAFAAERPQLPGVNIEETSLVRVEGFRITDIVHIDTASDVAVARNDVSPNGFVVTDSTRLRIERNHIHDLTIALQPAGVPGRRCTGFSDASGMYPRCGYGLKLYDVTDSVVTGNEIDHVPADGIQAGGLSRVEISDNFFHDISAYIDPTEHSDAIQLLGRNDRVTISRNRFERTRGILANPTPRDPRWGDGTATNLVVRDNAFVRIRDWSMHLVDASGAQLIGNTVWLSGRGVWLSDDSTYPAPMTGVVVAGNVFSELRDDPRAVTSSYDNTIVRGTLNGPGDTGREPSFADYEAGDVRLTAGPLRGAPPEVAGLPSGSWWQAAPRAVTSRSRGRTRRPDASRRRARTAAARAAGRSGAGGRR